jgi:putative addiction module component (TIGR02574 family)
LGVFASSSPVDCKVTLFYEKCNKSINGINIKQLTGKHALYFLIMISKEIKRLSVAERIVLVEEIWDSVSSRRISAAKDEISYVQARMREIKNGNKSTRTWDEIKADLRKQR